MGSLWYRCRVLTVHITYIIYSTLLWWKLIHIGKKTGHPEIETTIALVIWAVFYMLANGIFSISALSGNPMKYLLTTWCNIPMLIFIIFNLPPYGFTLKHMYEAHGHQVFIHQGSANHTCISPINIPMSDFILLQSVMPILLATFIIYPLPNRDFTSSEYLAIAVEFMNAFDIMDMVADEPYVEKYGSVWVVVFYLSLGMSAILIAFPIKIEQEDFTWPRNIIICSQSEISISKPTRSMSMTSILTAPYVIKTGEMVHRKVSIVSGMYGDKQDTIDSAEEITISSSQDETYKTVVRSYEKENISSETIISEVEFEHNTPVVIINTENTENDEVFAENDETVNSKPVNEKNAPNGAIESQSKFNNTKLKKKEIISRRMSYDITDEVWRKILKVILTVIFMDASFAAIRFKIMLTEHSADYGFNMFVKNVILATLHISYLLQHVKTLIVKKLQKLQ